LRWLVRGPEWWDQVQAHLNVGAVFDSLKCKEIPQFHVTVPPRVEQRAIARVLGSLDDKIELNRRMNQTLEEICRALFKFWFVDFGPVRAKAEGRWKKGESLPGMPADMWDLWPSEFEESEIGEIPKGWRVRGLGAVSNCRRELVDPSEVDPEERYVGLEHITSKSLSLSNWGRVGDTVSGKARFRRGDVLFGKLRPYFHKVCVPSFDGVASTDILTITPKSPNWIGFVIGHLDSSELVDYATAASNGTRMPRTNWGDLACWPVAMPSSEIAQAYSRWIMPLISKLGWAIDESRTLAATRDALLPKLLSGEIRVPLNKAQEANTA
jgi:type I restriction enzyme S subunit